MKRKTMVSILAGALALFMILGLVLSILPASVFAASSSAIKDELAELEAEAERIQQEKADLAQQQAQNTADTEDIVTRKMEIDQEIKLIHDEMNNINAQMQTYNQLIAEKQMELDDAQARQDQLNQQYKERIRAMEENGRISYWSVLFRARSFSEFLGNVSLMADIARADQAMLDELNAVAQEIQTAQAELAEEKAGLDAQRTALSESQAELDAKSAEATQILDELNDKTAELQAYYAEYEEKESELSASIAQKEQEYTEALQAEEEARREEEAAANNNNNSGSSGGNGNAGSEGGSSSGGASSSGWLYPLPYRVSITDAYGWRINPISGQRSFHHGTDFAAGSGTAIYASRSGTVTDAGYDDVYGYSVTINHGDGYSSLYAHMTHFVVSSGDYVTQGQVIGYVGSTGWSTGPHLHFSIYYNGSSVNPMNYV
ncbi:MAG TPA: peptidoglycan DD-metalloendopeptidase family protein [Candidatus Faecousia faecigallinarum]|nr:peptidoglycan DD-metalloendopeptidase family protein [Candidatus Faecousia faecigallinarum]